MKMTLLDLVQAILNKMNSDEVNSIGDTVESMQVAHEVMASYYALVTNRELPEQMGVISLNGSGTVDRPTHMTCPDTVDHIKWLKYNAGTPTLPEYKPVEYVSPEDFVMLCMNNVNGNAVKSVQDTSGVYFLIKTDKQPQYFTTFDDQTFIFDSFDAEVDDTLQESKVMAWGQTVPSFTLSDEFIPKLPIKMFPQLLAEATAACFMYWKQTASPTDERRSRQQLVRQMNNIDKVKKDSTANYGR